MRKPLKLSPYETKILSVLAESYPGSAHFAGGRKLRKGNWNRLLPEIEKSVEKKMSFLSAVESLEKHGVISVQWQRYRKGDRVSALFLENPALLYSLLGKATPEDILAEMIEILDSFKPEDQVSQDVISYIDFQLKNERKLLFQSTQELRRFLSLMAVTPSMAAQFTIRALSVHLYNDSKYLERMLSLFDKIVEAASGLKISDLLEIQRVYPETTVSGTFDIFFSDGRQWPLKDAVVTLPEKTVREIKKIVFAVDYPRIISIENKETFYLIASALKSFNAFIYCGGHLNSADRMLYELFAKNNIEIFHFGDLDPEGLLIFDEIDELVEKKLQPFMMNKEVFSKYKKYGYTLTPGALKRFNNLKNEKLTDLAMIIKESGIGIEQEIIEVNE